MSQEAERVYTINLGKAWLSPNNQRSKRAINMIREFATHHMKTEQIKIDQELSQAVWKRGIRSPPRKIRVKMAKTDEGYVLVTPYEEEIAKEVDEKKDKKKKKEEKSAKDEKTKPKKEPAKEEAKPKEEAKKEEPKQEKSEAKKEEPKKKEAPKKSEEKKPAKKEKSK